MTFIVAVLKLEVFNAMSSPRIVTKANQVLTINVTENVSVDLIHPAKMPQSVVPLHGHREQYISPTCHHGVIIVSRAAAAEHDL